MIQQRISIFTADLWLDGMKAIWLIDYFQNICVMQIFKDLCYTEGSYKERAKAVLVLENDKLNDPGN